MEFRLPAFGEGIDSATVVNVLVKPGDTVTAGQNVVAVETDKAAVEVPTETAGTVETVHVKPGDKVPIGAPILTLTGGATSAPAPNQPKARSESPPRPVAPAPPRDEPPGQTAHPAIVAAAARPDSCNGPATPETLGAAGPATRRLARELGVDLADVKG